MGIICSSFLRCSLLLWNTARVVWSVAVLLMAPVDSVACGQFLFVVRGLCPVEPGGRREDAADEHA